MVKAKSDAKSTASKLVKTNGISSSAAFTSVGRHMCCHFSSELPLLKATNKSGIKCPPAADSFAIGEGGWYKPVSKVSFSVSLYSSSSFCIAKAQGQGARRVDHQGMVHQ